MKIIKLIEGRANSSALFDLNKKKYIVHSEHSPVFLLRNDYTLDRFSFNTIIFILEENETKDLIEAHLSRIIFQSLNKHRIVECNIKLIDEMFKYSVGQYINHSNDNVVDDFFLEDDIEDEDENDNDEDIPLI